MIYWSLVPKENKYMCYILRCNISEPNTIDKLSKTYNV